MKTPLTISAAGHAAALLWGLVTFNATPHEVPPTESLPVDIVSATEFSELMKGSKTAPQAKAPKPLVEKVAEAKPIDNPATKIVDKPEVVPVAEKKPEPKPEPKKEAEKKPEPKFEPKPKEAEKKPEPAPKQAEKKPEPKPPLKLDDIADLIKREKPVAKKPDEAQPKFDAGRIAALLDKRTPQRQAFAGETLSSSPSLGVPTGNAPRLSQSEIDALRAQIQACWNPPVGLADAKDLIIEVRIMLREDGSLSAEPMLMNRMGHSMFQVAAESALRAVRRCQPYRLPIAKYEVWKDVEVTFDPRDMYRG